MVESEGPTGHSQSGCPELGWQQPFSNSRRKLLLGRKGPTSHTGCGWDAQYPVWDTHPCRGSPVPLPGTGSGRISQHPLTPSTLAVKMQLLDRGKGRWMDNSPSHNKINNIKRTATVEKMQIATQQQEKGKSDFRLRLPGASAGAGGWG